MNKVSFSAHGRKGCWLIVSFGEYQVMAQLIAKRVLISPLINKEFPVRHPVLARGNFASVNLNHQK
jgi:hypothetical protein